MLWKIPSQMCHVPNQLTGKDYLTLNQRPKRATGHQPNSTLSSQPNKSADQVGLISLCKNKLTFVLYLRLAYAAVEIILLRRDHVKVSTYHREQGSKNSNLLRTARRMVGPIDFQCGFTNHSRHGEWHVLSCKTVMWASTKY